jgi:hypothetical protein
MSMRLSIPFCILLLVASESQWTSGNHRPVIFMADSSAAQPKPPEPESGKPIVRGPVAPNVQPENLTNAPKVETWKPGEPVRVRPDLRRSDDKTK